MSTKMNEPARLDLDNTGLDLSDLEIDDLDFSEVSEAGNARSSEVVAASCTTCVCTCSCIVPV